MGSLVTNDQIYFLWKRKNNKINMIQEIISQKQFDQPYRSQLLNVIIRI